MSAPPRITPTQRWIARDMHERRPVQPLDEDEVQKDVVVVEDKQSALIRLVPPKASIENYRELTTFFQSIPKEELFPLLDGLSDAQLDSIYTKMTNNTDHDWFWEMEDFDTVVCDSLHEYAATASRPSVKRTILSELGTARDQIRHVSNGEGYLLLLLDKFVWSAPRVDDVHVPLYLPLRLVYKFEFNFVMDKLTPDEVKSIRGILQSNPPGFTVARTLFNRFMKDSSDFRVSNIAADKRAPLDVWNMISHYVGAGDAKPFKREPDYDERVFWVDETTQRQSRRVR